MDEVCVKIIWGLSNADCDIDVPVDATIRDVIEGLVNEGFLESDVAPTEIVFYRKDTGVKYDDRSKTIKEYGWENGDIIVAKYEALYGCPSAKEVPGIGPVCMLIYWNGCDIIDL